MPAIPAQTTRVRLAAAFCSLAAVSVTADLDAARGARLLFDAEIAADAIHANAVADPTVLDAIRSRPVPPAPLRWAQDVERKLGRYDHAKAVDKPLVAARRAVLGDSAAAPPRFLVRVDEFPHYQAWDDPARFGNDGFARFHEILQAAGVPYLVAALPRVSRAPLDPQGTESRPLTDEEAALLRHAAASAGVAIALHGRDHRTRFASPRRHSELCGLDAAATTKLLDEALAELDRHGIYPDVFVAPYNRFDAAQWPLLAARFPIVCGGPESIRQIGFQRTPVWRDGAVYLPAYAPFYGRAHEVLPAVERAIEARTGLWTPIVLHWGWESDAGWRELETLCARIAPYAAEWTEFRAAVERSR
jgi:peptidoglycan/xylan/chitin deacetylase (PgdA/CDA1 family)